MKILINRDMQTVEKKGIFGGSKGQAFTYSGSLRVEMSPEEIEMAKIGGLYSVPMGTALNGESDHNFPSLQSLVESNPYKTDGDSTESVELGLKNITDMVTLVNTRLNGMKAYAMPAFQEQVIDLDE